MTIPTLILIFILCATATTILCHASDTRPTLYKLSTGIYAPIETQVLDRTIHKLIGLPFAQIDSIFEKSREFRHSSKSAASNHTNNWSPICIQPLMYQNNLYGNFKLPHAFEMNINCLSISVYIPFNNNNNNNTKLLSAMLFIHGGSNAAGSSSFFDPSALAAQGNVLIATPNYRLDALGFLTMQSLFTDSPARFKGNYGLWDQFIALRWLHANCEALGCDPRSITLFGHSAGASDAMLLAQSPLARPFLKRTIMQSGSSLAHWAFLYERHLFDRIRLEAAGSERKSTFLLRALNVNRMKHMSTMNDTLRNYLVHSRCKTTQKYACFVRKLDEFYSVLSEESTGGDKAYALLRNIFERLDVGEIISLFGYFHKNAMDTLSEAEFLAGFQSVRLNASRLAEIKRNAIFNNSDLISVRSLFKRKNKMVSWFERA